MSKKVIIKPLVSAGKPGLDLKKGKLTEVDDYFAHQLVKEGKAEIVSVGTRAETRESKTVKAKRG